MKSKSKVTKSVTTNFTKIKMQMNEIINLNPISDESESLEEIDNINSDLIQREKNSKNIVKQKSILRKPKEDVDSKNQSKEFNVRHVVVENEEKQAPQKKTPKYLKILGRRKETTETFKITSSAHKIVLSLIKSGEDLENYLSQPKQILKVNDIIRK